MEVRQGVYNGDRLLMIRVKAGDCYVCVQEEKRQGQQVMKKKSGRKMKRKGKKKGRK
jgi:hypothetical protein